MPRNPDNAYLFLDFMLRPEVIARATNFTGYANANRSATALVDPAIAADPAIYPDAETRTAPARLADSGAQAGTAALAHLDQGQERTMTPADTTGAEFVNTPWRDPRAAALHRDRGPDQALR